ncbi:hypothetical protein CAL65_09175 [Alkalilimnicola ehrlichii]|uniref:DUF2569 domain-containing protein n=1 Tax=Alkalilimnicola ehrlichii TaxID=351052 RepID=A0A3E0WZX9_9GAMM|nr:hypothetical protein CAL65_09175 [Alkalilimnicola ehrlichii]
MPAWMPWMPKLLRWRVSWSGSYWLGSARVEMTGQYREMPGFLQFLVVVGLFSPIIVVGSVLLGQGSGSIYGYANSLLELVGVAGCSAVYFFSSLMLVKRVRSARLLYVLGWLLVSASPLLLPSTFDQFERFLMGLWINGLVGVLILFYLYKSKAVERYFSSEA